MREPRDPSRHNRIWSCLRGKPNATANVPDRRERGQTPGLRPSRPVSGLVGVRQANPNEEAGAPPRLVTLACWTVRSWPRRRTSNTSRTANRPTFAPTTKITCSMACVRPGGRDDRYFATPGYLMQKYVKRHPEVRKHLETCSSRGFSSPLLPYDFRTNFWKRTPCGILTRPRRSTCQIPKILELRTI
jgi:hypothetical protein